MSWKDTIRQAFAAKDQKAIDAAMAALDAMPEEGGVTVHNHLSPGETDRRDRRDDEAPPWFAEHKKDVDARFGAIHDVLKRMADGGLANWAEEEEEEPNHSGLDRRRSRDRSRRRSRDEEDPLEAKVDALRDAVSSVVDWARDQEKKEEAGDDEEEEEKSGGDKKSGDESMPEKDPEVEKKGEGFGDRKKKGDRKSGDDLGALKKDDGNESILGELEFEAPPGTGDAARRATDSAMLRDSFQEAIARAEIIAPGLRLPTYDMAAKPAKTLEIILGVRRTALDLAYNRAEVRTTIEAALGGRALDVKRMRPGEIRTLFNAVAARTADDNNARVGGGAVPTSGAPVSAGRLRSLGDINKANRERFGARRTA